jgi:N-acetyl sugar amidotransferase
MISSKICKIGIWDTSIKDIKFDSDGVSNYCRLQQKMMADYPRGEKGNNDWEELVKLIKKSGQNKPYDCIVGVSGGVDSSYLLHLLKQYNLRPLAVHLDNGFNSEIAVSNINKIITSLKIDLITHVVNYEEMKQLLKSYIRASMPWIDAPTDLAIKAVMYKFARKYSIKYILRGNDFRSEGKQPTEWTYSDFKQLKHLNNKFGEGIKLKTYPNQTFAKSLIDAFVNKIKDVRPYYYLEYNKMDAKQFLADKYEWKDYGGHHHENLFTKFAMAYWLPNKFSIDKRKINLSAKVLSGSCSREEALNQIKQPFDTEKNLEELKNYILKKLNLSLEEFTTIMSEENKNYKNYPSNYNLIYKNIKYFNWLIKSLYTFKPMSIESKEMIN